MKISVTSEQETLTQFKQHQHLLEILDKFKREVQDIYQENLSQLILFGSQARGEAKLDSDIDILVVLKDKLTKDEQQKKMVRLISDLCLEYEVLVSCVYVSELQLHQERSPLLLNIYREGIVL